jgi:hypothetical protein
MVDTVRSLSALQTILADNITGDITPQDVRDMLVSTYADETQVNLENGKTSTDTPDDEFDSGTLDGKWTVVDGGSGTVGLTNSSTTGVYDLTTRSGDLLLQYGNGNDVSLRQDYTLPDGNSIIVSCDAGVLSDGSIANNQNNLQFSLNDNDTSEDSGNLVTMWIDTDLNSVDILFYDGTTAHDTPANFDPLRRIYLRILRSGFDYYGYFSMNGSVWIPMGIANNGVAFDNIWISTSSTGAVDPVPFSAVHWIRQGSNSIDPW